MIHGPSNVKYNYCVKLSQPHPPNECKGVQYCLVVEYCTSQTQMFKSACRHIVKLLCKAKTLTAEMCTVVSQFG